jgi:hypothetical protein
VRQDQRDGLRVLVGDEVGDGFRVEPLQGFQGALLHIGGEVVHQGLGAVAAERLGERVLHIVGRGIDHEPAAGARGALVVELLEHHIELFGRDVGEAGHVVAHLLDFRVFQVLDDVGRGLFPHRHQQDRRLLRAGHLSDRHRASRCSLLQSVKPLNRILKLSNLEPGN